MAKIVIVDNSDKVIGSDTKPLARGKGLKHRIVRIFLFNKKGEIFLQKRSNDKDTWPGRWDQSAGGHVDAGEDYEQAAYREINEELGITRIKLKSITKYYSEDKYEGRIMKRFNMLYDAQYDGEMKLSKKEISEGSWFTLDYVSNWMKEKPSDFTPGFITAFKKTPQFIAGMN